MEKPRGKQNRIKQNLSIFALLPAGFLVGLLAGYFINQKTSVSGDLESGMPLMILFIIVAASMFAHVVIHEAGHLVFGLVTGYRFLSFRIGSLMLVREGGHFRLRRFALAGTGGQCIMIPPEWRERDFPFALYHLGGALMNLTTAAIALFLWVVIPSSRFWSSTLVLFSAVGLFNGLFNAIPMRFAMVDNDGSNVRMLKKDPQAVHAFYQMLHVHAKIASGSRLRDLPEEWFTLPLTADQANPLVMTIEVFAVNRLMDQQAFEEASARIHALLHSGASIAGIHRGLLRCDSAYCALMRGDVTAAHLELDPAQRKFMHTLRSSLSVLRTQYAEALLRNRDEKTAETLRTQFERIAKHYPYPSDTESERELMRAAEEKYRQLF